jgi:hypothetical protein
LDVRKVLKVTIFCGIIDLSHVDTSFILMVLSLLSITYLHDFFAYFFMHFILQLTMNKNLIHVWCFLLTFKLSIVILIELRNESRSTRFSPCSNCCWADSYPIYLGYVRVRIRARFFVPQFVVILSFSQKTWR